MIGNRRKTWYNITKLSKRNAEKRERNISETGVRNHDLKEHLNNEVETEQKKTYVDQCEGIKPEF